MGGWLFLIARGCAHDVAVVVCWSPDESLLFYNSLPLVMAFPPISSGGCVTVVRQILQHDVIDLSLANGAGETAAEMAANLGDADMTAAFAAEADGATSSTT